MPPSSTPQCKKWTLSMPELLSSSRGSMIFSRRRLTGVLSLVFLRSPNLMPTIHDGLRCRSKCLPSLLSQCLLVFSLQPRRYATEEVAYVLTLLSGRTPKWGIAVWRSRRLPAVLLLLIFTRRWRSCLTDQKKGSVTDYTIQFQTLAAGYGWNEGTLCAHFLEGLDYANELAAVDRELDNLINLVLHVEGRFNRRRQHCQSTTLSIHYFVAPPGILFIRCRESSVS